MPDAAIVICTLVVNIESKRECDFFFSWEFASHSVGWSYGFQGAGHRPSILYTPRNLSNFGNHTQSMCSIPLRYQILLLNSMRQQDPEFPSDPL
jgi:hypothetical protein